MSVAPQHLPDPSAGGVTLPPAIRPSGADDAGAVHPLEALIAEGRRQLEVCNACRYCEGYCAVFPAMERRAIFSDGEVVFLANLCHDCRACFQACPYTPPHDFAIDIPQILGDVRTRSYRKLAWPQPLSRAFERPFITQFAALAVGLALIIGAVAISAPGGFAASGDDPGAFYRVLPALVMEGLFLGLSTLVVGALAGSFVRFWREARDRSQPMPSRRAILEAFAAVATLRFMGGGGGGCYYPDPDLPARGRRLMHLLVLYGLVLAFAATVAAAVQQWVLGMLPPYPLVSVPVLLGTVGGAAVVIGGGGLAVLKLAAAPRRAVGDARLDFAFLFTLEVVTVSGMLLLALRSTGAMSWLLIVHLASVVALYLVVPFSKFVHASHRFAALLLDAEERVRGR